MLGISPLVAVVAWHAEDTNAPLVAAWRSLGVQAMLLVPPDVRALLGPDDVALVRLDVLIAQGEVVGAAERRARPGEWRTNISLGGTLAPGRPSRDACALGAAAAEAIGADFAGVDLLPTPDGYVVLELNGAADFDQRHSLPGRDVYADAARALGLVTEAVAADAA
jgi:hypothetical protein